MSEHGAIYTEVPTNSRPNKPTALQHVGDFANMVKAFIGSNYLALPFAFSQSGLGFGLGGLLIIVAMTDYCCQLLVKVKHIVVNNIVDTKRIQEKIERASSIANASTSSSSSSFTSPSPAASSTAEEDELAIHSFHQQVAKSLSYQDIGRIVFGTPGSVIVQMCLLLTQFGFCIGYFVFLGNTIYSMFPVKIVETNTSMPDINVTQSLPQLVTVLPGLSTSTSESIQNGSMGFYSTRSSLNSQVYSKHKTETIRISSTVSATTQAYQPTSLGTTRTPNTQGTQTTFTTPKIFNSSDNSEHQTIMSNSSEISHLLEMTEGKEGKILTDANSSMVAGSSPSYVSDDNVNDTTSDSSIKAGGNFSVVNGSSSDTFTQNSNSSDSFTQNRTKRFVENIDDRRVTIPIYLPQETMSSLTSSATIGNQTVISTAPALQYLVLVPGPVFIFFSWIRHVRSMGPISLIANLAIFAGFVSVLCYLIVGFTVSESVVWFKLETFPIFFGQVTTAYEGIGLIIPIESSMENNRHSFASFLH
ncbi:uncharacterized protein LOC106170662, partial [Lingula anatina]|uniref:Uncharacterized protein LOC106170662 n=1 Tax=Lingula anatina TaxID=7574 RepID=A0A1S3J8A4_LINAN